MGFIRLSIEKPVAVIVAVILVLLFGIIAFTSIPVQLTPNVDSTVVTVTTTWEGASPNEIEQDIVEKQEDKLRGLSGLKKMTSSSGSGSGQIKLEFQVGINKEAALRETSDRLREVPSYPEGVDEPVILENDPQNRDYIAWIIFSTADESFDIRTLQDFAEDNIKTALERVPGIATVNVLGGFEREVQARVDPLRLAQYGLTYGQLFDALRNDNVNISAGSVEQGKSSISVRTIGRYERVEEIEDTIIETGAGGSVRIGDVAQAVLTYKEPGSFVRSKGHTVIAINVQRELGTNVMEVMDGLKQAIDRLNAPGALLDTHAKQLGLSAPLNLRQVFDQTIYIDQAIGLVRNNIFIGGALAIITLVLFLRSARSVGIIALAIPISVVGTFVAMVAMGRNLNVISLAGLAFAVGMVVDNAIVILENIYRHLEAGATARQAAYRATTEVWGAVLASTLTTIIVFVPILFIQEDAGQLFRDIAMAICAAVALSLIVSITVVPCASRFWLAFGRSKSKQSTMTAGSRVTDVRAGSGPGALLGRAIYALCGSALARIALVVVFAVASIGLSFWLMPPTDYLPSGNRNLVFGIIVPPPGYNIDKQYELGQRVENIIRPYWQAGELKDNPEAYKKALAALPTVPTFDWATGQPGPSVRPPAIENYFFVAATGFMFHGGVSDDEKRVVDMATLFNHATRSDILPGVLGFANQAPLFRLAGASGSSINVEIIGDEIDAVTRAAQGAFQVFGPKYGYERVRSQPSNFDKPAPRLNIKVDRRRAADLGLTTRDVGLAVRALGDGANVDEFRLGGEAIDLKVLDVNAFAPDGSRRQRDIDALWDVPVATPVQLTIPLGSVASLTRTTAPLQINHVEQQRAVSFEITPPEGMPLGQAIDDIQSTLDELRSTGQIPPTIRTPIAGSADKLTAVREALLGDGTFVGLLKSRFFLAMLINYLLMCVLFESFLYPLVILFSVPLATLGGFLGLNIAHRWTAANPYLPTQNLDILTMLGFIILLGTVVNNAILIVHQTLNFMGARGHHDSSIGEPLPARAAIAMSVRTRLRPIMMTAMTTIGGTLPLVIMPGSGSELYRGLGSVVLGGLLVSTFFTLILIPLLLSLVLDLRAWLGRMTGWKSLGNGNSGHEEPLEATASIVAPREQAAAKPKPAKDPAGSEPENGAVKQPAAPRPQDAPTAASQVTPTWEP